MFVPWQKDAERLSRAFCPYYTRCLVGLWIGWFPSFWRRQNWRLRWSGFNILHFQYAKDGTWRLDIPQATMPTHANIWSRATCTHSDTLANVQKLYSYRSYSVMQFRLLGSKLHSCAANRFPFIRLFRFPTTWAYKIWDLVSAVFCSFESADGVGSWILLVALMIDGRILSGLVWASQKLIKIVCA